MIKDTKMYKRLLALVALSVLLSGGQLVPSKKKKKVRTDMALVSSKTITLFPSSIIETPQCLYMTSSFTGSTPVWIGLDTILTSHLPLSCDYDATSTWVPTEFETEDAKRRRWVQKVLDEEIPWSERFQDSYGNQWDPLGLAICMCDEALVASVLAHEEGKVLLKHGGIYAPLNTEKIRKLLFNEPLLNVNQDVGSFPAVVGDLCSVPPVIAHQLLGDARLRLLDGSESTERGVSVKELINAIMSNNGNWVQAKGFLVAFVSRKDFSARITEEFFNALQWHRHVNMKKDWDARMFIDYFKQKKSFCKPNAKN
jgi:hypothetical protein